LEEPLLLFLGCLFIFVAQEVPPKHLSVVPPFQLLLRHLLNMQVSVHLLLEFILFFVVVLFVVFVLLVFVFLAALLLHVQFIVDGRLLLRLGLLLLEDIAAVHRIRASMRLSIIFNLTCL